MTNIKTDIFHPDHSAYYTYSKHQPFYKRIFRRFPYCQKCRKKVQLHKPMLGIPVTENIFTELHESDMVKSLFNRDWSVLDTAERLTDWYAQPAIFISLGRCETCDGPFIVLNEIHGLSNNRLNLGVLFLMEVDKECGLELLEKAIDRNLIANDALYAKAVKFCKVLGSSKDFKQIELIRQRKQQAVKLGHQGMTHKNKGKLDKAEADLMSALQIFEALGDRKYQAVTNMNLGSTYYSQKKLDQAETFYKKSLALFEQINCQLDVAMNYGLLGTVYLDQKWFNQAELMFQKSLEVSKIIDNKNEIVTAYHALGCVYKAWDKRDEARDVFTEALKLCQILGDKASVKTLQFELDQLNP